MDYTSATRPTAAAILALLVAGCDIGTKPQERPGLAFEPEHDLSVQQHRCAAMVPTAEQLASIEREVRHAKENYDSQAADGVVEISVYFHVIREHSGRGDVSESQIQEQMRILNEAFRGAAGGAYTQFRFSLVAVTRTKRTTWHRYIRDKSYERQMKSALKVGGANSLNVYVGRPTGGILGWATFPWEYHEDSVLDGVVLHYATLPGGGQDKYNEGDTLVHEVGHWLGLWHTFEGGCSGGDQVDDTPSQLNPNWGCPVGTDSCPGAGPDPIYNYMNYTDDRCMNQFTPGQAQRVREIHAIYRNAYSGFPVIASRPDDWDHPKRLLR